ncbi:MAG: 16S rRNA (cytosine(1402)-N(4))-methyltransferase RsmH [Candidatus Nanopelagicales bacterium]
MPEPHHVPVMGERICELLAPALSAGGVMIDATVGLAGHTLLVLERFPDVRVVGIDRDPDALRIATERTAGFPGRFVPHAGVFDDIPVALAAAGADTAAAVLFDLGVSSMQLDSDRRGFAYSRETILDMRMDPTAPVTAADVVNGYDTEELARVFRQYGEERFAGRIARAIVAARSTAPVTTTTQLADLCDSAVPMAGRRRGHPAKRVFQALRIEVNDELGALRRALDVAVRSTRLEGRLAVLSYHSLEDRIVKRAFAAGAHPPVPAGLPVVPDSARPFLDLLTRGAEKPSDAEIADNPRAASARLRAVSRTGAVLPGWEVAAADHCLTARTAPGLRFPTIARGGASARVNSCRSWPSSPDCSGRA